MTGWNGGGAGNDADIPAALALAKEHHRAGRLGEADRLYRSVLARAPNNPDALHLRGLIAHHTGRHAEAVDLIERALSHRPDLVQPRNNLGVVLKALERWDEAAAAFSAVIEADPGSADAHFNLGTVLQEAGRLEGAEAAYRRAAELDPHAPDALTNLGVLLIDREQAEEAREVLEAASRTHPDFVPAHYNLASALRALERFDEAVSVYRRVIHLAPGLARAHLQLGEVLGRLGRLDEALEAYHRSVEIELSPIEADAAAEGYTPASGEQIGLQQLQKFHVIANEWALDGYDPDERFLLPINPLIEAAAGKVPRTLAVEDVCFRDSIVSIARFARCDTSFPCMVLADVLNPCGKKYRVIDGTHRLHKLVHSGAREARFHVFDLDEVKGLIKPYEEYLPRQ